MTPRAAALGIVIVSAVTVVVLTGWFLADYANQIDNTHWIGSPLPPCFVSKTACAGHLLGTDEVGRDVLARLIVGARTSLSISLLGAMSEILVVGVAVAAIRRSPRVRPIVQAVAGIVSSLTAWPVLVVVAILIFHKGLLLLTIAAVAVVSGMLMAARTLLELQRKAPTSLVATIVRDWAALLLMLATLDFFGYGVQPPTASLGNMLANGQANLQIAWWAAVFPAMCLFAIAIAIELSARAISGRALPLPSE